MLSLVVLLATIVLANFPSDKEIKGCLLTKLYAVHLCSTSKDYVQISRVSSFLKKAILLSEDSTFYQHSGFDFQEMENSLKKNLEKGRFARGGSTITQQLAKNLFLSKEKTLTRKFKEALITIRLEKILSKNEIFEKYLNVIQFGKNIFGVKKAAEFYFKKSPSELNIVESSFLAFLLPGPEVYAKSFFRKKLTPFAVKRMNDILSKLHATNQIDDDDYLLASAELETFLSGPVAATISEQDDLILEEETVQETDQDFL